MDMINNIQQERKKNDATAQPKKSKNNHHQKFSSIPKSILKAKRMQHDQASKIINIHYDLSAEMSADIYAFLCNN